MTDAQSRDVVQTTQPSSAPVGDRWAIVVGISQYEDPTLNLKYADRDAKEFYDLIRTPAGGGFKENHVQFLLNGDATTRNIYKALRGFLKKPARDDLVVVYLACHGAPDPERPNNIYLLTHDVDPDDIAGTALPMGDINNSLRGTLRAEKLVMIVDTCHSAAIGSGRGRRSVVNSTAAVNEYLQSLSTAKGGVALLTSAEANETALEDERWGGGHGVFTHYVLEGMRGAADKKPVDGKVTVGELFEYVREQVMLATDHRQHPTIGTTPFDRTLPMAVPGLEAAARLDREAQACYQGGDLDAAFTRWRDALNLVPDHPGALDGIAKIERDRAEAERKRRAQEAERQRQEEEAERQKRQAVEQKQRELLTLRRKGTLPPSLYTLCIDLLNKDEDALTTQEREILEFIDEITTGRMTGTAFVSSVQLVITEDEAKHQAAEEAKRQEAEAEREAKAEEERRHLAEAEAKRKADEEKQRSQTAIATKRKADEEETEQIEAANAKRRVVEEKRALQARAEARRQTEEDEHRRRADAKAKGIGAEEAKRQEKHGAPASEHPREQPAPLPPSVVPKRRLKLWIGGVAVLLVGVILVVLETFQGGSVEPLDSIVADTTMVFLTEELAPSTAESTPVDLSQVFLEAAVDEPPERLAGPNPRYPEMLRQAGIEGSVVLEFVIDTTGRVEETSIKLLSSTNRAFEGPAGDVIRGSVYRPGRVRGIPVRVLVQQSILFNILVDLSQIFLEAAVDEPPERLTSPPPQYPEMLRQAGIEGSVVLEFVVDTTGRVEETSMNIVSSTNMAFEAPARDVILRSVYRPGRVRGVPVRVRVRQSISFNIQRD